MGSAGVTLNRHETALGVGCGACVASLSGNAIFPNGSRNTSVNLDGEVIHNRVESGDFTENPGVVRDDDIVDRTINIAGNACGDARSEAPNLTKQHARVLSECCLARKRTGVDCVRAYGGVHTRVNFGDDTVQVRMHASVKTVKLLLHTGVEGPSRQCARGASPNTEGYARVSLGRKS